MAEIEEGQGMTLDRRLGLFVCYELSLCVVMLASWWVANLVVLWVGALIVGLRFVAYMAWFGAQLRPLRALGRAPSRASEAELIAADSTMQHLTRRCARVLAVSWALTELAWLAAMVFDVPVPVPSGAPEHLAGLLIVCASPGFAPITELLLDVILAPLRTTLARELAARGLAPPRPRSAIIRPVAGAALWLMLGGSLSIGCGVVSWSAQAQRQHTVELELARVSHSLERVEDGEPALEGVELLRFDELPPELAARLVAAGLEMDAARPGEVLSRNEIERGEVLTFASVGAGGVLLSRASPRQDLRTMVGVLLLLALFAGPLFGLVFWLFGRMLSAPLEQLSTAAGRFVSAGELDALERLVPERNDEIGRLAASFRGVVALLGELSAAASAVADGDLRVELDHPGQLHGAFRGMLVRLNEIVARLRETSLELASAATEINVLLEEQEQAALTQSSSIQQVAITVSSLSEAAEQIAEAAKQARSDAEQSVATTDASAAQSAALRAHTASIGELLLVIGDIAARSDLLALNGSLEATRAGEAGRGFALVAAEMRRLAERVSGTVADVRAQVSDVEASSAQTVTATEQSRVLATRTAEAARAIDELSAAQNTDTDQASIGVQATAESVVHASRAISQIRDATEGLRIHAGELERLLGSFMLLTEEQRREREASAPGRGSSPPRDLSRR